MSEVNKRILFLCARRSVRMLMAASVLTAQAPGEWDIWIAPGTFSEQEIVQAHQILSEVHLPLLLSPQTAEPTFNRSWDEGIIVCSGATDQ